MNHFVIHLKLSQHCSLTMLSRFSCVRLFVTPWTVAHQALLSTRFSRQEYWRGLLFPSTGDLPDIGIEPRSPALQVDSLLTVLYLSLLYKL